MAATRTARLLAVGAALALVVGACTRDEESTEPPPATTTSAPPAALTCPAGDDVPPAGPARGTDPQPVPDGGDVPEGAVLVIGTLLPRTGDLAFLGTGPVVGVERAAADLEAAGGVLGGPVGLVHADSADGDPAASAAGIDRLVEAGVAAVVGPLSSATAALALERSAPAGTVVVTPGATATALERLDGSGRLFRTAADEVLQGRALAELVLDDGAQRVDVVARDDEHGRTIADAFTAALEDGGGTVVRRIDRAPDADAPDLAGLDGDATIVIGLAESAAVIDALEGAGRGPRVHPTYGTDGNLGERLGDLVADRRSLACLRGVLPLAPPDPDLARDDDLDPAALDHAAEAYDAVVAIALAAEVAGGAEPAALAGALAGVTRGGTPCDRPAPCLDLVRAGTDIAYVGRSGRAALDEAGNRTRAVVTVVAFDADGHLARLGAREAGTRAAG